MTQNRLYSDFYTQLNRYKHRQSKQTSEPVLFLCSQWTLTSLADTAVRGEALVQDACIDLEAGIDFSIN